MFGCWPMNEDSGYNTGFQPFCTVYSHFLILVQFEMSLGKHMSYNLQAMYNDLPIVGTCITTNIIMYIVI